MPRVPSYRFDARTGRYRGEGGRFLPKTDVRKALDAVIENAGNDVRKLAGRLQAGDINPLQWEREMRQVIKSAHLSSSALAKGGWAQMTPRDFGRTGPVIKEQYQYLSKFAEQVRTNQSIFESQGLGNRAAMYVESARGTFQTADQREAEDRGMTKERNILGPSDHCDECRFETSRGWVDIGELTPVGSRQCLANCKCLVEYR